MDDSFVFMRNDLQPSMDDISVFMNIFGGTTYVDGELDSEGANVDDG